VDGTLAQQAAGLTAYTMWNDRVYGEVGVYRSAPLGVPRPLDSTATGVISGAAPYWRVALPNVWGQNYLSIGTYGMAASVYPTGVAGATNRFTDVAVDVAYMRSFGSNSFTLDGTWIHEKQTWTAGGRGQRHEYASHIPDGRDVPHRSTIRVHHRAVRYDRLEGQCAVRPGAYGRESHRQSGQ